MDPPRMVRGLLRLAVAAGPAWRWTAVTLLRHALRGQGLLTVGARLLRLTRTVRTRLRLTRTVRTRLLTRTVRAGLWRPAAVRAWLVVAHRVFPFRCS
ncbi:hypothetical protein [Streptomyces sp. NPDC058657]|uniref:hypothetical protein n=1 Tax=unclassified Streptomyces TaxID=2593676 RepID=UPI0036541DAE